MNKISTLIVSLSLHCFESHGMEERMPYLNQFPQGNIPKEALGIVSQDFQEVVSISRPLEKQIFPAIGPGKDPTVWLLSAGESKIIKKTRGYYIYVPEIMYGAALIARTENLVAVASFIEDCDSKLPLFLNSLLDKEPILHLTLYGRFYSQVVESISLLLKRKQMELNKVHLSSAIVTGEMKEGNILHPHIAVSNNTEAVHPCRFAVDCQDGMLLDLNHSFQEHLDGPVPFNFSTSVISYLNYGALSTLLKRKERDEVTKEHVDLMIDRYKLYEGK